MELITTETLMRGLLERWRKQYLIKEEDEYEGEDAYTYDYIPTYYKLKALPDTATEQDIVAIIGNYSWTRISCDECGEEKTVGVMLGEVPNDESHTAIICRDCLKKALALVEGELENGI